MSETKQKYKEKRENQSGAGAPHSNPPEADKRRFASKRSIDGAIPSRRKPYMIVSFAKFYDDIAPPAEAVVIEEQAM